MEWMKDGYLISDDKKLLDIEAIVTLLSKSYWASDRPQEVIERSIDNSISFGVYYNQEQVAFARAVTDKVVFTWVMDVIVREDFRSQGIGKKLIECLLEHPDIKETKVSLATKDAHTLYEKFGFERQECMRRGPSF
ncbi:GNAT family N-acetyltransferase [Aneurinibacillus tyrosinisolvens]|uniref:GNAT family N-acetyltransferase n=1 Tax=Aneurinibacillus tyrosinisolvens TaxID=1443435 RepID=UPI00063EDD2A|nr:GNAT family N-acetyltransferase [Aneurinibacillus tyrosinisolvens]